MMVNHQPAAVTLDKNIRGREQGAAGFTVWKPNFLVLNSDDHGTVGILPDKWIGHTHRKLGEAVEEVFIAALDRIPSNHWRFADPENVKDLSIVVPHAIQRPGVPPRERRVITGVRGFNGFGIRGRLGQRPTRPSRENPKHSPTD
jgi:hypothetical protein